MPKTTKRQTQMLHFIDSFIQRVGYSPSYQEIAKSMNISKSTVSSHLMRLRDMGYIKFTNQTRSIKLIEEMRLKPQNIRVPLLGTVAAGAPLKVMDSHYETIELPPYFSSGADLFALKVLGDSMIEEGIHSGDTIICRKTNHADNGDTVVALLHDAVTVKKWHRWNELIELKPANDEMDSLFVNENDVDIQGVVISLIRNYEQ